MHVCKVCNFTWKPCPRKLDLQHGALERLKNVWIRNELNELEESHSRLGESDEDCPYLIMHELSESIRGLNESVRVFPDIWTCMDSTSWLKTR